MTPPALAADVCWTLLPMGLRPGMWLMTDVASWPVATPRFSSRWAADSSLTAAGDGDGDDVDDVLDDDHVAADDQYDGELPVDGTGPQVLAGDVDCSTVPGGLDQIIVRTPPVRYTKSYFRSPLVHTIFLSDVLSIIIIIIIICSG